AAASICPPVVRMLLVPLSPGHTLCGLYIAHAMEETFARSALQTLSGKPCTWLVTICPLVAAMLSILGRPGTLVEPSWSDGWQGERHGEPPIRIACGPYPAPMCRDNGPAEGEPQAHAPGLGGEKGMEQARYARLVYARATILHCYHDTSRGCRCG